MVRKTNSSYNFTKMEKILLTLDDDHSYSKLTALKNELNKFFNKSTCANALYTTNTDKLFFGMRVYPMLREPETYKILHSDDPVEIERYYVEIDSKLYDPMLGLTEKEVLAMLLHEIGHIVYDTSTIDEVKKQIDYYLADSVDGIDGIGKFNPKVIAYGIKDAMFKQASLFAKFGNEEMIADAFVFSCGYGEELESGFKKILKSSMYINKDVDNRFIILSWAFRVNRDIRMSRLQSIKTLNKAKSLCASTLEKHAIEDTIDVLSTSGTTFANESGIIDNVKARFNAKFASFKAKGIKSIKQDIYELNLRLRVAETESDLLYVIRTVNNDVSILQDYITEPEVDEEERKEIEDVLLELYSIREKAAKYKEVRCGSDSMIQVIYPDLS